MGELSRTKIIDLFKNGKLKVVDGSKQWNTDSKSPYSRDNYFQQCSIDLHVGSIFVPDSKPEQDGSQFHPKHFDHVLNAGQTVMIRTKEKITLPLNIGGTCFSPSHLALKAILITNMGHVDPGYDGHLHFTAINMGKSPFTFRHGDEICAMILFDIGEDAAPYGKETFRDIQTNGKTYSVPGAIANFFPNLAKDFVDVESRSKKIAKKQIWKTSWLHFGVPFISALLVIIGTAIPTWMTSYRNAELRELKAQMQSIKAELDYNNRIQNLEQRHEHLNGDNK